MSTESDLQQSQTGDDETHREEEVGVPGVPEDSSTYRQKLVYKLSTYLYYLSTNVDKCRQMCLYLTYSIHRDILLTSFSNNIMYSELPLNKFGWLLL